jgi:hypothetical protein
VKNRICFSYFAKVNIKDLELKQGTNDIGERNISAH